MDSYLNISNLVQSSKNVVVPQLISKNQKVNKDIENQKEISFLNSCSINSHFVKSKSNRQQQQKQSNTKRCSKKMQIPVKRHEQLFYEPEDSYAMLDYLELILEVDRIDECEPKKSLLASYIGCCTDKKFNAQNFKCLATKQREMFIYNIQSNELQIYINFNTVQASLMSNMWDSSFSNTMSSVCQGKKMSNSKKNKSWQHNHIILDFDGKLTLSFSCQKNNSEKLLQWGDYLKKIIQQSYGKLYNLCELTNNQEFYKKKYKLQRQFLDDCQTGDLLLFQGNNMMAKAQRFFTNSQFDHVGMVVRDKLYNILVFQTNGISGSCLTPWSMIISYEWYKTVDKIVWRKLEGVQRTFEFQKKIANFIKQNIKTKYHISIKKLLSDKSYNGLERNDEHGFFCSELIARVYKSMNFLPDSQNQPNYKPACQYLPYDFTEKGKLKLTNGASLSGEYQLLFDQAGLLEDSYENAIGNNSKVFQKKK